MQPPGTHTSGPNPAPAPAPSRPAPPARYLAYHPGLIFLALTTSWEEYSGLMNSLLQVRV